MHTRRWRRAGRWLGTAVVVASLTSVALTLGPAASAQGTPVAAGTALRVSVPGAIGGKTVIGQLAVAGATEPGFVTAYGCDDGLPRDAAGEVSRADLNYHGHLSPVWSNRLIVEADDDGDICLFTWETVDMIVDVNAVSFDTGITSFPNRRTDTRIDSLPVGARQVLRVTVPEAVGGRTVIGELAVDDASQPGFVTAYGCDDGLPTDTTGAVTRADLNYDGNVSPVWSNRLIVQADADGEICLFTWAGVDMIIDINGVADTGVTSFANRRTDTRRGRGSVGARGVMRVVVPEAVGGKTVIGQLAVDRVDEPGFVTAYGCADGLPLDPLGDVDRADLNYDGAVTPVWSNRMIVQADADGAICLFTWAAAHLIVDINGVSDDAAVQSFPNRRTDTRNATQPSERDVPVDADGIPLWPPYDTFDAVAGTAALTGEPADSTVTNRPILAVKIDNYRRARPQFGLETADAVIELNVEGITRFIALYQTELPSFVGPVRSARTADLDLLAGMNRPVFAYSGANPTVSGWVEAGAESDLLVDLGAQHSPCYFRDLTRPGPHNLLLDPTCAVTAAPTAGPAGPLWQIDDAWTTPAGVSSTPDTTFSVPLDGVLVGWTWNPTAGVYERTQDYAAHLAESGLRIAAHNVVQLSSRHVPSPADARSPHPITLGSGDAVVHRDGLAIPATWSRATPYEPFAFVAAGTDVAIPLDRGTTFLEIVRDGQVGAGAGLTRG